MARRVSMRQMRREAPEWIFPWKRRGEPLMPKLIAVCTAVAFFGWLVGFVRIQTTTPNPWGLDKASVIHVTDTAEGRALALKARENGPTPVRFQTSDWPQLRSYEEGEIARLTLSDHTYQPRFQPWPTKTAAVPSLSQPDVGVLPAPPPAPPHAAPPLAGVPQPKILPLSGLQVEEVPLDLPAYEGAMDAAMMSESVRLLIQLAGDGRVQDCIALSGGDTPEATAQLIAWVRGVRFLRSSTEGPQWAAVRIRFLNQPR